MLMEWMTTIDAPGKRCLMQGNEAIVRGALEAGVHFAASYPGSPSSQVLGLLGKAAAKFGFYAEWSSNEVCAFESCLGASFANGRSLCIVKQNGLLCLEDALHCASLDGVRGGLVLVTSDDPDAHSSTNEFDSRHTAVSAVIPLLEPADFQETKDMIPYAFELSEALGQIVLVRVTTRICHGRGVVELGAFPKAHRPFRPIGKWDRSLGINWMHQEQLAQLDRAAELFEDNPFNHYYGPPAPRELIICGGTGLLYCREALSELGLSDSVGLLALGTLWPLPRRLLLKHLASCRRLLVAEEVDPFLEEHISALVGKEKLQMDICGRDGDLLPRTHELNPEVVLEGISRFLGLPAPRRELPACPFDVPERELFFCAGCPHRATFYLLRQAMNMDPRPTVVIGDIGCYIMATQRTGQYVLHSCGAMGSGVNVAEGLSQLTKYGFDQPVVTICGDSTFFHTIIPGLINAKFNQANMLLIVLDNSATAMTGFQPHPGTGITAMGQPTDPVSIGNIVQAIGVDMYHADPFEVDRTRQLLYELLVKPGLKVLMMSQPCATLAAKTRAKRRVWVDQDLCLGDGCGCGRLCSRVWGCPGNSWDFAKGKAVIDEVVCVGCGVCADLCPAGAIKMEGGEDK